MAWPLLARARARALRSLFRWQRIIYRACLTTNPEHLPALCWGRHSKDSCDGPWTAGWPVAGQCVACTTFQQQMEQNVKQHYPRICRPRISAIPNVYATYGVGNSSARDRIARNPCSQIPLFGTLSPRDSHYSSCEKTAADVDTSSDESIPSVPVGLVDWMCMKLEYKTQPASSTRDTRQEGVSNMPNFSTAGAISPIYALCGTFNHGASSKCTRCDGHRTRHPNLRFYRHHSASPLGETTLDGHTVPTIFGEVTGWMLEKEREYAIGDQVE